MKYSALSCLILASRIAARRDILKARVNLGDEDENGNKLSEKEIHKQHVEIVGEGDAYDEYNYYYGEEDRFEPWDLSDDELESRLTTLSKRIDEDNDGFITTQELLIWTFKSLHAIDSRESAEEDFSMFDEDENDSVSWIEFLSEEYGIEEGDIEPIEEVAEQDQPGEVETMLDMEYSRYYARVKARFDVADRDSNGELDYEEFQDFKNPFAKEEVKDDFQELVLKAVDENKNNMIDREEFMNDWKSPPPEIDLAVDAVLNGKKETKTTKSEQYMTMLIDFMTQEKKNFDMLFDIDNDEYLSGGEILLWLSPENADLAWEETKILIEECDRNEDGRLTIEEIIDEMDIWIDSDATEYGEQLRLYDEL